MELTLNAILSAGYLEIAAAPLCAPLGKPQLSLGEVEAMIAYCRLDLARHLQQRDAANSPEAKLALEDAEVELLTAMNSIGAACGFIERDMAWWDGERAA